MTDADVSDQALRETFFYNQLHHNDWNMKKGARDGMFTVSSKKKKYKLLLSSDDTRFGGKGSTHPKEVTAEKIPWDDQEYSIPYELPAYGAAIFEF